MAKKKTKKEFIDDAIKIHGDEYDYGLVIYVNARSKVIIIDKKCGTKHFIPPYSHLSGTKCNIKNAIDKTAFFIKQATLIHVNEYYDYGLVIYKKGGSGVIIIDKQFNTKHLISPERLLSGNKCCIKNAIDKTDYVIKRITQIHGNVYDCSMVNYISKKFKVTLIDTDYGSKHEMLYLNILAGKKCCIRNTIDKTAYIIIKFKHLNGNLYGYSKVNYIDSHTEVIITCYKHGDYNQTPNNHLNGDGCPDCNLSKGELGISKCLYNLNIKYNTQKTFDGCVYKSKLKFDFYLPNHNLCIEYDGKQHFESVEFFGGEKALVNRKRNDGIKNTYCKNNNIKLLRIPYWEFNNIEKIIKEELCL